MQVEDALKAFAAIAGLYDGTPESGERIIVLTHELIERPETFWEKCFDAVNENDPILKHAQTLIRSGAVNDSTTFADLPRIVANPARGGDAK
ncbi:MAG TPA: hypothetical protein VGG45_10765 [Terracidiphilus sp.]|jgi:hypothetical protein